MVKGLSRRVVVIKFPDTKVFEQAIFFVKEEEQEGVSVEQMIQEACTAAEGYVRLKKRRFSPLVYTGIGAGATAVIWVAFTLFVH